MSNKREVYGIWWEPAVPDLHIEMEMIRRGGRFKFHHKFVGNGAYFHWRRFQEILWPEAIWHRWRELETECYLKHKYVGEMGCAAAGKSHTAAINVLTDWYIWPSCTTGLKELELRIFGVVKKYHKLAKERFPWLDGCLIEGKMMITFDEREEAKEGRDFRNGIVGVACKKGTSYVGLSTYVGIHNKRIRMIGDELHMMPRAFLDAISNLAKCPDFKFVGLGNPNETTNAHGFVCEPAAHVGGWEGGIDQTPKTKTWETKMPNGIAIQLPGSDCPNMDDPPGTPPRFPFLITREQLEDDAKIWGTEDWHYTMMDEGMMPRGQGQRRFLTRQAAQRFGAMLPPIWLNSNQTKLLFLDAAYRGVGGDRCVFGEMDFGEEASPEPGVVLVDSLLNQVIPDRQKRYIISLIDIMTIPISAEKGAEQAEDQIVKFVMGQARDRGIPPERLYFDAGMKTSLVTAFSRLWSPNVNSIDFGGKPSERKVSYDIDISCRDYYSKFVTELWGSVRLTVEAGQFRGMTEDVLHEFCTREWKMASGNRMEAETKDDMKKKCGRSPDLADGVAIGLEGARQLGFVIRRLKPENEEEVNPGAWKWKQELRDRVRKIREASELNYSA